VKPKLSQRLEPVWRWFDGNTWPADLRARIGGVLFSFVDHPAHARRRWRFHLRYIVAPPPPPPAELRLVPSPAGYVMQAMLDASRELDEEIDRVAANGHAR
jgi:hypothetical protein